MKRILLALLLATMFGCATMGKTECVRPASQFVKIGLEDLGDASRLEQIARKNYATHKEWVSYAECLSR